MTQFFKMAYMPFFDQVKGVKKNSAGMTVEASLVMFCQETFPGLIESF